jgi:hypothetical protein
MEVTWWQVQSVYSSNSLMALPRAFAELPGRGQCVLRRTIARRCVTTLNPLESYKHAVETPVSPPAAVCYFLRHSSDQWCRCSKSVTSAISAQRYCGRLHDIHITMKRNLPITRGVIVLHDGPRCPGQAVLCVLAGIRLPHTAYHVGIKYSWQILIHGGLKLWFVIPSVFTIKTVLHLQTK